MNYLDEASRSGNTGDAARVRAEARDVISDALAWQLPHARWQAIEPVLVAMSAALAADDPAALTAATADLELAGPMRVTRIGAIPVVPPPPPVRDRLNRLVFSLGGTSAPGEAPEASGANEPR